jgi:squalene-hopene/tetraprenyl-beta-curcumene cyclase
MSLGSIGCQEHPLVQRGIEFLLSAVRADASWAVGSNLAISDTAMALNRIVGEHAGHSTTHSQTGLQHRGAESESHELLPQRPWDDTARVNDAFVATAAMDSGLETIADGLIHAAQDEQLLDERCLQWLLNLQHTARNPVTEAPAGGWGWSDSPGALPNTTDTSRVLLALVRWRRRFAQLHSDRIDLAAKRGISWLVDLQNDDGGWPTFYREPGSAAFDKSRVDVTAHALRALFAWKSHLLDEAPAESMQSASVTLPSVVDAAIQHGVRFLEAQQSADGSFTPLWFGNEHHEGGRNPVYGTSQVIAMCSELGLLESEMALHAARWLVSAQHASGGWGPPRAPLDYSGTEKDGFRAWRGNESMAKLCSVEETAIAVSALLPLAETNHSCARAVTNGLTWLAAAVEQDAHRRGAIIGFYLPKIWYHDRLYPLLFAAGALSQAARQLEPQRHAVAPIS